MKKLFLSMMLLALPILASAYDCQVDGIYYNLNSEEETAEVTYQSKDLYDNITSVYSGSVDIPERFTYEGVDYTVASIAYRAFYNCSGLTSITIPNSVTSIGGGAFENCSGLTSVTIPNSVTTIGWGAFENCNSLTSVTIPNSVTSIGGGAFRNCSGLTSITIPNSVTSIEGDAFMDCSGLTSVTIPNSVTTIGWNAFYNCTGLTSVAIPNSVTTIGGYAFAGCFRLTSVTIPNSVTSIQLDAFLNCSGLTSVTIPNSVTSIEWGAFDGCSGLTSVTIPNSVTSIKGGAFRDCSGLTSVTIPNSVTSIKSETFKDCSSLTSVTIPNSVTSIEGWAFMDCSSLTSVTIGSSVSWIGQKAFAECSKLEEVYCLAENVPNTQTNAFESSYPENATLYVPAGALNDYKTTEPWSLFGTIKAIGGDDNKCATPTISYADKKLTFSCATEGAQCLYTITDSDIKTDLANEVSLSATYEISVYATKSGYTNSDVATATLVWTDAIFTETTPETPTSAKAVQESIPVLISAKGGNISVKCEADGQEVNVYTIDGLSLGTATVKNGEALISTSIPSGDIAVVKVGGRSVKVIMR